MASDILKMEFHYTAAIEQIFIVSFPQQIEAELFHWIKARVIEWVNELNGALKWIKIGVLNKSLWLKSAIMSGDWGQSYFNKINTLRVNKIDSCLHFTFITGKNFGNYYSVW